MIELIKGLSSIPNMHIELVLFKNLIEYPEVYSMGIPIHIIERKPKRNPITFLKVYRICKQVRPDILHTWSSMSAIFAFPAVMLLNAKLLNGNIAKAPNKPSIWDKDLLRAKLTFLFSDIIVGNSNAGLKAYGAPKVKSVCIHNGFDFKRIENIEDPKLILKNYKISTDFVIGKIAAFENRKDYETFIGAANRINQIRDDVTFMAVGDGQLLQSIKNLVPERMKDKVIFTGPVLNVESIINIFDTGILSTNKDVHGEGISNSIMEYMAMGKPVIATEGGGTSEIVIDGQTGFVIPPKSPGVLADKILELLDNRQMANQFGSAGQQRIRIHFNQKKMTQSYLKLYKKLIDPVS